MLCLFVCLFLLARVLYFLVILSIPNCVSCSGIGGVGIRESAGMVGDAGGGAVPLLVFLLA